MTPVVAVIAPGAMGAAVGRRLTDHGLKVLTSLKGRSAETVKRAEAARMVPASDEEIARQISRIWGGRVDRYSDLRWEQVRGGDYQPRVHKKIEMITLGG